MLFKYLLLYNNQQIYTSWRRKNKNVYTAGGFNMKQIITLDNGTRVEIDGNEVKLIAVNGSTLYETNNVPYVKDKDVPALPYFFFMGKPEREAVAEWFNEVNPKVDKEKENQREFLDRVEKALKIIDYDYCISTLEPSFDENGNIFYEEGKPVGRGIKLEEWKERANKFYNDKKWHSELAQLEEGDLFKAYRIAMGLWSLEYVCDDSSSAGNYWNAPNSSRDFEVSGARKVGGFKDGIGNTYEIYQTESGFALVGGYYSYGGDFYPVADVYYRDGPSDIDYYGSGVVVLKRSTVH